MSSFSDLGLPADLTAYLAARGISEAFPVQSATLPAALAGRDICAQSPTGSGKTLAFVLPLVARLGKARPGLPRALVLAPTRELAAQIASVAAGLASLRRRRVTSFYGGTGFKEQLLALRDGTDVAVGCPGRMMDLLDRGALDLADVETVVIDEADRMSDMGFLPAVERLLDQIRGERQTMLYTATLSSDVERLVRGYQAHPLRAIVGEAPGSTGSRSHEFRLTTVGERAAAAARLVAAHSSSIVFCRTRRGVDSLTRHLTQAGIAAVAIHGERSQVDRDQALAMFRNGRARVLVGTDVASRGLHIQGVDCVLHYDPPADDDTYLHRSGRTGRAGADGMVVSLVTAEQEAASLKLQKRLALRPGGGQQHGFKAEPLLVTRAAQTEGNGQLAVLRPRAGSRQEGGAVSRPPSSPGARRRQRKP